MKFEPGNTFGTGRPRGTRNKLARKFLEDCYAHWQEHGARALNIFYRQDPARYCVMMASIVPKELEVTATAMVEYTDEELIQRIEDCRRVLQLASPSVKVIEHDRAPN